MFVLSLAFYSGYAGCISPSSHNRVQVQKGDCVTCHLTDYNNATNPVHVGAFPTTCGVCHGEQSWVPAELHHPWPLTGAHATTACNLCHTGTPPRYAGTPTECVGCHQADYDSSPYPGHSSFPTTCADCHSTTAWSPALEGAHPENRFPIKSGAHSGIACMDCHDASRGSSAGGMNTNCIGCHTHDLTRANSQHSEVRGYVPDASRPNFCLDCHPNGRGGG